VRHLLAILSESVCTCRSALSDIGVVEEVDRALGRQLRWVGQHDRSRASARVVLHGGRERVTGRGPPSSGETNVPPRCEHGHGVEIRAADSTSRRGRPRRPGVSLRTSSCTRGSGPQVTAAVVRPTRRRQLALKTVRRHPVDLQRRGPHGNGRPVPEEAHVGEHLDRHPANGVEQQHVESVFDVAAYAGAVHDPNGVGVAFLTSLRRVGVQRVATRRSDWTQRFKQANDPPVAT